MWYVQQCDLIIIYAKYLYYAYHPKIYANSERAKAWTAPGQSDYPVSFFFSNQPVIYLDTEELVSVAQISIEDVGAAGQTWNFVAALNG